jgi:hypothetical protein
MLRRCVPRQLLQALTRGPESRRACKVAQQLNAGPGHASWSEFFYQIANRIAHLHFLREHSRG